MKLNFIAFAIPLFLAFILWEYRTSKKKNKNIYRFDETIANLNVGIAERLSDLLTTGAFYFIFSWINKHLSIYEIKESFLSWVLLFFLTDLVWYWYHRFGHVVNLFWSVHVVHHQSDDFNYSVSVRITVLQAIARGLFWSVLPLIGFQAHMITVILLVHGAYPFFTHTQMIGKLGWLEYFLVTPSHHRVHHSSNEEYLDKNYGDVLIIWDKMFGTFAKEEREPVYGLTKPLNSHSFLWQHFHFILELIVAFRMAKGFKNKIKVIFGKPDLIDPRIRTYLEKKFSSKKEHIPLSETLMKLVKAQTIITMAVLFFMILLSYYLSPYQLMLLSGFIILSLITTGAMLEQRSWVFQLEFIKLGLTGFFICTFFSSELLYFFNCFCLASLLLFYRTLNQRYYKLLYNFQYQDSR